MGFGSVPVGGSGGRVFAVGGWWWRASQEGGAGAGGDLTNHRMPPIAPANQPPVRLVVIENPLAP